MRFRCTDYLPPQLCHVYRETVKTRRANPDWYLSIPGWTLFSEKFAGDVGKGDETAD